MSRGFAFIIILIFVALAAPFSFGFSLLSAPDVEPPSSILEIVGPTYQAEDPYRVSASTDPAELLLGLTILIFVFLFPRIESVFTGEQAGFWRRLGGFAVDYIVFSMAFVPFVAAAALIAEASRLETFSWVVERSFHRPGDFLFFGLSEVWLHIGLGFYFFLHAVFSRQTIGQYFSGYTITPEGNRVTKLDAAKRAVLLIIAIPLWPLALIHGLVNKKVFWWDLGSRTRAVLSRPSRRGIGG